MKQIPPTKDKCNARLTKRDGYCEKKGVMPNARCNYHSGSLTKHNPEATLLFKEALTPNQALKLQTLIEDQMSMTGEIAVQKIELLESLKDAQFLKKTYHEMLADKIPLPEPINEDDPEDIERYKLECDAYQEAVDVWQKQLDEIKDAYEKTTKREQSLADQITKSVERNSRMLEGKKYTIDIRQLVEVLNVQVDILANRCEGCPKLALVANDFRDMKIKGIGNVKDLANMMKGMPKEVRENVKSKINEIREENIRKVKMNLRDIQEAEAEILDNIE